MATKRPHQCDGLVYKTSYTEVYVYRRGEEIRLVFDADDGYYSVSLEINFCPKCGKKLNLEDITPESPSHLDDEDD